MKRATLAQILVAQHHLSAEAAEQYEERARQAGQSFAAYIAEQEAVSASALTQAYASLLGLAFIDAISEKMVPVDLLSRASFRFLRDRAVMPVWYNDTVAIAFAEPATMQAAGEIAQLVAPQAPLVMAPAKVIVDAINRYYPLEGASEMIKELAQEQELQGVELAAQATEDILEGESEAPVIKFVNQMLYQAVKQDASDIHIEPYEKEVRIRFRVDGVLHTMFTPPKRVQSALTSRIKIMASMNIAEKRQPQDNRIQIKIADKAVDIRVSVLPVTFGERIVMRLLDKNRTFAKLSDLNMSERDYQVLQEAMHAPNGIVFITGPTGSGKTSTLYAMLSELNAPEVNIVTVEDPVEYQMQGIGQVQVHEKIGLTFAASLRSILRQDPDIVMIGETRDAETAQIAIQAALTGHLVLSTLHTNSSAAAITRLIDMGIEPFLIASSVIAIVAQRLVRRLCDACKKRVAMDPAFARRLGLTPHAMKDIVFYGPQGCEQCMGTGYRGRIAIFEVMHMSRTVAQLTMQRADAGVLETQARRDGMRLLVEDGVRKIAQGLTSADEVLAVAVSHDEEIPADE
jgi:general secretion pathway protein E